MSYDEKGTWAYLVASAGAYLVYLAIVGDRLLRDVRDKEIYRFGEYASRWFVAAGAGAALIMAMVKLDYFWIANVIYLGFVLWAVVGSAVRLVAYRRGLSKP